MIKVSAMYPHTSDARFDFAYYVQKHMPMVKDRAGEVCKYPGDHGRHPNYTDITPVIQISDVVVG